MDTLKGRLLSQAEGKPNRIEVCASLEMEALERIQELEAKLAKAREIWKPITRQPSPGQSYLVWLGGLGMPTYDVAYYEGRKPNGEHWWILADISLDQSLITHYAEITPPTDDAQEAG